MALIDRRIGLLFVVFLALLGVAVVRAAYLGAVRAGSLQQAAATQQVTQRSDSRRARARSPTATASSWRSASPPTTSLADPYLIKDPLAAAQQARAAARQAGAHGARAADQAAHRLRRTWPICFPADQARAPIVEAADQRDHD